MTTIAANRRCMAADTNINDIDAFYEGAPKIERVGVTLVGCAGDMAAIKQFLRWFRKGGKGKRPEFGKKASLSALVLTPKGLFACDSELEFDEIRSPYYAIGTGAVIALTAMDHGDSPYEAVESACKRDPNNTKPPITSLELEP